MKKTLKNIPTSKISRGMRLAGLTATVGAQVIGSKVSTLFANKLEKEAKGLVSKIRQAQAIADTLSQMKGAAMKLGQILSIHGEDLFPKEVTAILAKLQQNSDEMEFAEIRKVLKKELGPKLQTELAEISERPIASASIGQVHRAIYTPENLPVALKVQYPGVDKSIDSDIDALASLLSVVARIPNLKGFKEVTKEVKTVLKHETDYHREAQHIALFRDYFKNDPVIVVPKAIEAISTKRVLATELIEGISPQEFGPSRASTEERNVLGKKFLEVFYHEMFRLGQVQTDPNFANYKIQPGPKLALLDFGAVKTFTKEFRENYKRFSRFALNDDYDGIRDCAIELDFLKKDDAPELVEAHYKLVKLFLEPFEGDKPYRWHDNDLAERIRKFIPSFIMAFKLRPPPKDIVFLNRKIVGIYFFLSTVKAEFNPRPLLESFVSS